MKKTKLEKLAILIILIIIFLAEPYIKNETENQNESKQENIATSNQISYEMSNIPEYSGEIYALINNNKPKFSENDMQIDEYYSDLRDGRVGMAIIKTCWKKANADNEKDDYSSIIPSGFVQKQYDADIVVGKYLYHRCHLIGWSIGGVDVDKRNLMAGTRDFNVKGMKKFEDKVYDYLKQNQTNHVLYRVTPHFEGNNKLANGVNMEAYSIEDNGVLHFNVYVYNVQDGIAIDYSTGESKLAD